MENMQQSKKILFIGLIAGVILLSAAVGSFLGFMAGALGDSFFPLPEWIQKIKNDSHKQSNYPSEAQKEIVIQEDSAVISVVEKVSPAVVSIVVTKDVPRLRSFFDDPSNFGFFFNPFGLPQESETETEKQKVGGGSGFFVSKDGKIITNKHVVSDPKAEYTVVMSDGRELPAEVISRHPLLDVALIKIQGNDFPFLEFGDSDALKVGQTAIAIGNPLGEFANSVSRGIVSGLKRNIIAGSGLGDSERLTNIIQTDAAINPGNSGGPLLDIDGKVIGVNVAVAQGVENIGFALPSNQANKFIEQIEKTGKVSIPFIGVRYIVINEDLRKENNLQVDYGALILRGEKMTDFAVVPGSPADKAGLAENDIILEIEGNKITEKNSLSDMISKYEVGNELIFKIWRKGDIKETRIKLEERK